MRLMALQLFWRRTTRTFGALTVVLVASWSCSRSVFAGYPPTWVPPATAATWAANEEAIKGYSMTLHPIAADSTDKVPFAAGDTATLSLLHPDPRHGAADKRFLGLNDSTRSNVLAQVTLVEGMEYKTNPAFRHGWLPLAILVVPDSSLGDSIVYPKLKLRGGTSWLFVRQDSVTSVWGASLVRIVGGTIYQDSLMITAQTDSLPPNPEARFVWNPNDDIIWAKCGTNCCKVYAQ